MVLQERLEVMQPVDVLVRSKLVGRPQGFALVTHEVEPRTSGNPNSIQDAAAAVTAARALRLFVHPRSVTCRVWGKPLGPDPSSGVLRLESRDFSERGVTGLRLA
jgi:hypothetical protein